VITLLVAGHKTTTLLSSWCLYLLSQHEDVEERLVKEIFEVFGDDIDKKITAADIKQCVYFDQVLKETLRYSSFRPFLQLFVSFFLLKRSIRCIFSCFILI
jgi:cytochrome P450